MTSKEALIRIKTHIKLLERRGGTARYKIPYNRYEEDCKLIKQDLDLLELIRYALKHSTRTSYTLPDGMTKTCDMNCVEEFIDFITEWEWLNK